MNSAHRLIVLPLCCAAAAMIATACEDADARRRAEVQATITSAGERLWQTTAVVLDPTDENSAQVQQNLAAIIRDVADTSGAEPAQQATAALLAASAHRQLAAIALAQAQRIEAAHRTKRVMLHGMIDTATRLDTLASSLEAMNVDAKQAQLARDRDDAQAQLREHSQQMASLDGPIAELTGLNRDDQAEVQRLRTEANRLRREADDRGRADGFATYQQAVHLERQADRIEYEIAQREIELRYTQQPQHTFAESRVEHAQAMIAAIDDARQSLDDLIQTLAEQAQVTRQEIAEFRDSIGAALGELRQVAAGPLKDLYDRGAQELQGAAARAEAATGLVQGDPADGARIEAARAHHDLGTMHWSVAQGLEDHVALLERLVAAPGALADAEPLAAELDAARAEAETAIERAKAAYTEAQDALNQVTGRTARRQLEALKNNITLAISALAGEAIDWSSAQTPGGQGAAPPTSHEVLGVGAESPEALVAALRAASDLESGMRTSTDLTYIKFRSQVERDLHGALIESSRATLELERALKDRFGTGLMESALQAMAGGADMMGPGAAGIDLTNLQPDEVSLGEVSGDRGTIIVSAQGQREELGIIRVNGRWYLDGTDLFAALFAVGDAQLNMARKSMETMSTLMGGLARRVGAGEFASIDEVLQALGQQMQQQMDSPFGLPEGFEAPGM